MGEDAGPVRTALRTLTYTGTGGPALRMGGGQCGLQNEATEIQFLPCPENIRELWGQICHHLSPANSFYLSTKATRLQGG